MNMHTCIVFIANQVYTSIYRSMQVFFESNVVFNAIWWAIWCSQFVQLQIRIISIPNHKYSWVSGEEGGIVSTVSGGMRYIRIVSRIISGGEGGIVEARWAATCVRIMKVTLNSPVNIVLMARAIITPLLHTPSDFSPFQFHFHSLKDLQLFANNHKFLDSIANPVLANQVCQCHWETKKCQW